MARFADMSLTKFLDALSSPDPTPGGGTAAAIAGAIGTALLGMVAGLTKTRTQAEGEVKALAAARAALAETRARLMTLADVDTEAFNQVLAAYRLPKATDGEKTARKEAVQRALRAATEAPLDTLRVTAEAVAQDTSQAVLSRADSALYSAKAAGRNVVFQHCGSTIRAVEKQELLVEPVEPVDEPPPRFSEGFKVVADTFGEPNSDDLGAKSTVAKPAGPAKAAGSTCRVETVS